MRFFYRQQDIFMIKRITFLLNLALIFVFIFLTKISFAKNTKSPVENVTKETLAKVEALRGEYPEFKLGKNSQNV